MYTQSDREPSLDMSPIASSPTMVRTADSACVAQSGGGHRFIGPAVCTFKSISAVKMKKKKVRQSIRTVPTTFAIIFSIDVSTK